MVTKILVIVTCLAACLSARAQPGGIQKITSQNGSVTISPASGTGAVIDLSSTNSGGVGGTNVVFIKGGANIVTSTNGQTNIVTLAATNTFERTISIVGKGTFLYNVFATNGSFDVWGTPTLSAGTTASFTGADLGKYIAIMYAGGGISTGTWTNFLAVITNVVSGNHVQVNATPVTTVQGVLGAYDFDESATIQAALNYASSNGGWTILGQGLFICTTNIADVGNPLGGHHNSQFTVPDLGNPIPIFGNSVTFKGVNEIGFNNQTSGTNNPAASTNSFVLWSACTNYGGSVFSDQNYAHPSYTNTNTPIFFSPIALNFDNVVLLHSAHMMGLDLRGSTSTIIHNSKVQADWGYYNSHQSTDTNCIGIALPQWQNPGQDVLDGVVQCVGQYTGIMLGEHGTIIKLQIQTCQNGVCYDWAQGDPNNIYELEANQVQNIVFKSIHEQIPWNNQVHIDWLDEESCVTLVSNAGANFGPGHIGLNQDIAALVCNPSDGNGGSPFISITSYGNSVWPITTFSENNKLYADHYFQSGGQAYFFDVPIITSSNLTSLPNPALEIDAGNSGYAGIQARHGGAIDGLIQMNAPVGFGDGWFKEVIPGVSTPWQFDSQGDLFLTQNIYAVSSFIQFIDATQGFFTNSVTSASFIGGAQLLTNGNASLFFGGGQLPLSVLPGSLPALSTNNGAVLTNMHWSGQEPGQATSQFPTFDAQGTPVLTNAIIALVSGDGTGLTNIRSTNIVYSVRDVTNNTAVFPTDSIIRCWGTNQYLSNSTLGQFVVVKSMGYGGSVVITNQGTVYDVPGVGTETNAVLLGARNSPSNTWAGIQ